MEPRPPRIYSDSYLPKDLLHLDFVKESGPDETEDRSVIFSQLSGITVFSDWDRDGSSSGFRPDPSLPCKLTVTRGHRVDPRPVPRVQDTRLVRRDRGDGGTPKTVQGTPVQSGKEQRPSRGS